MTATAIDLLSTRFGHLRLHPRNDFAPPENSPEPQMKQADTVELSQARSYDLKFDFYYDKVMRASRGATFLDGDRARSVSQELYQRVTGRFSLDLSFVFGLAEKSGRAAAIAEEAYNAFVDAAKGLADFDEESLKTFAGAVDDFFTAAERAMGLAEDDLDPFANSVKSAVKGFFREISTRVEEMKAADEASRRQFRDQLKAFFEPPEDEAKQNGLQPIDRMLRDAGVPEKQRSSLMKLAAQVLKLHQDKGESEAQNLLDKLNEVAKRYIRAQRETGEEKEEGAEPSAVARAPKARAFRLYEYTESAERAQVDVQQRRLDILAA